MRSLPIVLLSILSSGIELSLRLPGGSKEAQAVHDRLKQAYARDFAGQPDIKLAYSASSGIVR